jgi:single-strand DNA-binding protein
MASFNKVILMGNLTRDPQMKYLPSQTPVVDFGLAVNRRFKTQSGEEREETTFVDCSAFGRQAEVIHQWCTKGKQLFIEGRLKFDTWDDKNGGGKRSKLSVIVETFQFVGGRDGVSERDAPTNAAPRPKQAEMAFEKSAPTAAKSPVSEQAVFAEADIPF